MEPEPLKFLQNREFIETIREDSEHPRIITMLLDNGIEISLGDRDGESPLHLSVISKPRVDALLQYTKQGHDGLLDVDARDKYGRTPLHYAAVACNAEIMELLIEHGADPSAKDKDGVTTMHFVVWSPQCIEVAM